MKKSRFKASQDNFPVCFFSFVLFVCLLLCFISVADGAVFGSDPRYTLWPNPSRIPYQIQADNLNAQDFSVLSAAMNQINSDTGGCIKFAPYDSSIDRGSDFVLFRNRLTAGIIDICHTFPGLVRNNGFGQVVVMFGSVSWPGTTGVSPRATLQGACLDNQRDAMRVLMNLLSVRNEHNRIDRGTFLAFQSADPNALVTATLQKYNLFTQYPNSSIATIASTFDYNSVTLVSGEKYAAALHQPVFVPVGTNTVGSLARLSRTDCQVINLLYRCSATCPDPYSSTGTVRFNTPTTFAKHLYCPPLIASSFLTTPIVVGDVSVSNAPGVTFTYTLTPAVSYLTVISTTATVFAQTLPAARILLTQIPNKGFVNGQFTLTATAGNLQGSTTVTLTINCVPQFVSSTGGRPNFAQPNPISQPTTFNNPTDVFSISIGNSINAGIYVNCKDNDPINAQATYLPSTLGFVTATDPEGGRVSYYITAPFPESAFGKAYSVTQDGVICFADNNGDPFKPTQIPYGAPFTGTEDVHVAAVDPAGGVSVIHYTIFVQCAPPEG